MADMRVLVAGASGAVGRALVPALLGRGHTVAGLVRSEAGGAFVASQGAQPFVVDALDATAVSACFDRFRPDAVVHQLTALPDATDLRDFDRVLRPDERPAHARHRQPRRRGSRRRGRAPFRGASFCGWPYARVGGPVKTEDDPLDPNPPAALRRTLDAIRHLEGAVTAATDLHGSQPALWRLLRTRARR
jgi:NAD(P)-dependent dehydrogenase (short-subunit alcohol dehydrogenase family)